MRKKLHRHDLSCEKDFSTNMGYLIPVHWRMCYPGDIVRQRSEFMVRVSPMLAPIVSKVMIKCESFFVPTDIIWTNAQAFYSGGQDGADANTIPKTTIVGPQPAAGTLANFMGVSPPLGVESREVNVLPFRAYRSIWNWHYRDRDLQTEAVCPLTNGPDTTTDVLNLARRCWERDRFTTARLEPQRGDDVLIPMAVDAPLDPAIPSITRVTNAAAWETYITATNSQPTDGTVTTSGGSPSRSGVGDLSLDPVGGLTLPAGIVADLSDAAGTIRELQEAVAINRFRLRLQQSDGSYPDYTLATFGIRSPDIELQKPVLLARSSHPLQISEIVQTAPDDGDTDPTIGVGTLFGHGIASVRGHGFKYTIKRHGYIMTLFSVIPKTMYVQGCDKEFFRTTKEDYFDPDLDQIGEEAIAMKEVYSAHSTPDADFGYQYRNYCDRSSLNTIGGEFSTSVLNFWHQARSFSADVALNDTFVTATPTDRIFALGSTVNQLRVKAMHDVKMLRVMRRIPMRGIL